MRQEVKGGPAHVFHRKPKIGARRSPCPALPIGAERGFPGHVREAERPIQNPKSEIQNPKAQAPLRQDARALGDLASQPEEGPGGSQGNGLSSHGKALARLSCQDILGAETARDQGAAARDGLAGDCCLGADAQTGHPSWQAATKKPPEVPWDFAN